MLNLREMEEQERVLDKKLKDRNQRAAFIRFLETEVRQDRLTKKTLYSEHVQEMKNEESFYNVIGQEPCNPRDLFLDCKQKLAENQTIIKKMFLEILKSNLEAFPLEISVSNFTDALFSFPKMRSFYENNLCNSYEFIGAYLHKKLMKRQTKALSRLVKMYYNLQITYKTHFEDISRDLREHKFASYFESISEIEKRRIFNEFKSYLSDENKLLQFVESKIHSKDKKDKRGRGPPSPVYLERKEKMEREEKSEAKGRKRSYDKKSDDTEQGEIKDLDFDPTNLKKIKRD